MEHFVNKETLDNLTSVLLEQYETPSYKISCFCTFDFGTIQLINKMKVKRTGIAEVISGENRSGFVLNRQMTEKVVLIH